MFLPNGEHITTGDPNLPGNKAMMGAKHFGEPCDYTPTIRITPPPDSYMITAGPYSASAPTVEEAAAMLESVGVVLDLSLLLPKMPPAATSNTADTTPT